MNYLDQVKPTYIENWPNALEWLSIAHVDVPLTVEEAKHLHSSIMEWGDFKFDQLVLDSIADRVRAAAGKFPNGAFVRLGSRSPKDSWLGHKQKYLVEATDGNPLRFIQDCSERMHEDLSLAIANNYAPHIFVRQYMKIEPWQEWRCFMRNQQFVGISQYDYNEFFHECVQNKDSVRWAIEQFSSKFVDASHLNSVVFDVLVFKKQSKPDGILTTTWEVKLLEINPFFEMTDPCLFSWRGGGDFDGGIRVVTEQKKKPQPEIDLGD